MHFALAATFRYDLDDLPSAAGGSFAVMQTPRLHDGRAFLLGVDADSRLAVAALNANGDLIKRFVGDGDTGQVVGICRANYALDFGSGTPGVPE